MMKAPLNCGRTYAPGHESLFIVDKVGLGGESLSDPVLRVLEVACICELSVR